MRPSHAIHALEHDVPPFAGPSARQTAAWMPLLAFVLLACAIGVTGFSVFEQYRKRVQQEAQETLAAVAELKTGQIERWREELIQSAEVMARDPFLAMEIERWLKRKTPSDAGAENILRRLQSVTKAHDFEGTFIIDRQGRVRDLPVTPEAQPPTPHGMSVVMDVMRAGQPLLTDLHKGAGAPPIRLDLIVPIFAHGEVGGRVIAAIYFRIDPRRYLFPLLHSWPTPSPSAESLLARREKDSILYLNDLRHRAGTALSLRFPAASGELLAAKMARGEEGTLEGRDYRGAEVIGVTKKIANSPWFLVVKTDASELYAPIRRTSWVVAGLTSVFITLTGLALGLWWRQQRARYLARQYADELKQQVLKQQYSALMRYANDIILTTDESGKILEANERAVQTYGHARADLQSMHVRDLQAPEAPATFPTDWWNRWADKGLIYETCHRRADGSTFPVEVSARAIDIRGRQYRLAIIRDISERKQAEQQQRLAARVFGGSSEAIFITDAQNKIVSVNQAFTEITGFSEEEAIGRDPRLLKSGRHDAAFFHAMAEAIRKEGRWQGEIWNRRKNGEIYPAWVAISTIRDETGEVCHYVAHYTDISELKQAEENLRLWSRALESSVNAIYFIDVRREGYPVFYVNPAHERVTGYSREEVLGRSCRLLEDNGHNQLQIAELQQAIHEQRDGSAVLNHYRKDGSLFWLEMFFSPVRDEAGTVTHYIGILNDISERKNYEEQLERHANYDDLTGLANRNLLQECLSQDIAHARRQQTELAVLHLDIDNFKLVVDSLGHEGSDRLLRAVAARMKVMIHDVDTAARWGGDEFIMLLAGLTSKAHLPSMVQRILNGLSKPFLIDGQELHVTFSAGISIFPKDGQDGETLLKQANAAMCLAREQGRNHFQFYAQDMNVQGLQHLMLENSLRHALKRGEFLLHYQPKVDLQSGEMFGMEALLRWRHPEMGMISPANFIPMAEETGLIVPIGEWVLRTACAQNKAWQDAGFAPMCVSVNLSVRQFWQRNLVEMVDTALRATGLDPRYLELEITESLFMRKAEEAIVVMRGLKSLGIKLSLDDFGTGYSSLGYLKRFQIDTLKIDQSFVREITHSPDDAAIVNAVISMAHDMRIHVVAEGVETEAQLSFLRQHHCDAMQGYFFSKPLPAEGLSRLLESAMRLPVPSGEPGSRERTLLLLDDEPSMLSSLNRLLRHDGYTILTAESCGDAFNLLASRQVGVLLVDQRMPEMSGIEFLKRARLLYPDTVRMMISGYTQLSIVTDAVNDGAVYKFLLKPWDNEQLRAHVRDAFLHYEMMRDSRHGPPVPGVDAGMEEVPAVGEVLAPS